MKQYYLILLFFISCAAFSQQQDTTAVYKKKVLESAEIEFLSSYYKQEGSHSAVGGGIGTEELTDFTGNVVISVPMNADDVLTIDAGFSAYTSASSGNINPFEPGTSGTTSASRSAWLAKNAHRDDDDDDDDDKPTKPYGTPWSASTGASNQDALVSVNADYSHSSDNRNTIWNVHGSVSNEFDYQSIGFGAGIARLFNKKNSEVSLKGSAYLDRWMPIYPTELHEYSLYGLDFQNQGHFDGVTVYDQNGMESTNYLPLDFKEFSSTNRNSYAVSVGFSQVVTKKLQVSVFMDFLYQEGLLSTPYHRIYFADKPNFYIGEIAYIPVYDTPENTAVYRLSDDIERLPSTRFKIPIGARLNYYLNEKFIVRTYYRFYRDDWDLEAHTFNIEIPYKITDAFTVYPIYRFYTQKQVRWFAPFEKHFSTETFYTSDYDLSTFDSNQFGFGVSYIDILAQKRILKFGLKNIDFRYNHYSRSDKLEADVFSVAIKFIH